MASVLYAPLQSKIGRDYLERFDLSVVGFNSYVVIDSGAAFVKSAAVIKMAYHMGSIWRLMSYLIYLVPTPLADAIYTFGFNRRIQWFGRNTQCRLLKPSQRHRFLDLGDGFKTL